MPLLADKQILRPGEMSRLRHEDVLRVGRRIVECGVFCNDRWGP